MTICPYGFGCVPYDGGCCDEWLLLGEYMALALLL
jgi:hypothetical protein